jgi:hypothetical protein
MDRAIAPVALCLGLFGIAFFAVGQVTSLWPASKVSVTGLTVTNLQAALDSGEISDVRFDLTKTIEMPVDGESWDAIAYAFDTFTLVALYCATDAGTVVIDIENDDGTPASIHTSAMTCDSDGTLIDPLQGSWYWVADDTLDLIIGAITGTPAYVSFHLYGEKYLD